jgi:hypothetical protein
VGSGAGIGGDSGISLVQDVEGGASCFLGDPGNGAIEGGAGCSTDGGCSPGDPVDAPVGQSGSS